MNEDSKSEQVYKELRRLILTNQILQGSYLNEYEWASNLDIDPSILRDVLNRLLGEGLVTLDRSKGYFVTELTAEDVNQLIEIREILEVENIKLVFDRITKSQIDELEDICDAIREMVLKGDHAQAWDADLNFHEKLIGFSGNHMLLHTYTTSHIPLFHQTIGKTKSYLKDDDLTDNEHYTIVRALREKDLDLAVNTLRDHIRRSGRSILSEESSFPSKNS